MPVHRYRAYIKYASSTIFAAAKDAMVPLNRPISTQRVEVGVMARRRKMPRLSRNTDVKSSATAPLGWPRMAAGGSKMIKRPDVTVVDSSICKMYSRHCQKVSDKSIASRLCSVAQRRVFPANQFIPWRTTGPSSRPKRSLRHRAACQPVRS